MSNNDQRRARRIALNAPTNVEAVGQIDIQLHPNLEKVYQRVMPDRRAIGKRFPAVIRDLSTNGAFISGEALPLLARVAFQFPLEGFGKVEAMAWVLWRREADCEVPLPDGQMVTLPRGFGVLFESVALEARMAIHKLCSAP
jgi:hypothetical protein